MAAKGASRAADIPTVRGHIARRRGLLALSGLLSAIGNAAGLVPYITVYFVAVAILGRPLAAVDAWRLWLLSAIAPGAVVVKTLATGLATHCSHLAAYDVLYDLRIGIAEKLGTLPLGYFGDRTTGEVKKVIHEDVEGLEEGLAHLIPDLVGGLTVPLATLAILIAADWRLALATVALLPLAIGMYGWVAARAGVARYNELNARINGVVIQYINGMKVLKTFMRADASFAQLRKVVEEMRAYYQGPYGASAPALAVILTVVRANLLLIVPLGVLFYLDGTLTLPIFVLFLTLGIGFNRPIWTLFSSYGTAAWQVNNASQRIDALFAAPSLAEPATRLEPHGTAIAFEGVSFRYREAPLVADTSGVAPTEGATDGSLVLRDVSFLLPEGSVTALVGPSGAGKSTIAKLIPRFWDVTGGWITLGGVDIRDVGTAPLLDRIAFVFQDVFLFNDTVRENIRAGKPDATDEQIAAAARAARCEEFIADLPQGYDTPIGENGSRLSGGQRQRLSIARAILKDAPIVILDEATAFLDPESEAQVQAALAALVGAGKTVLIIAHRLSTITEVDQIIVIAEGTVAARGTHAELLAASALYKGFWDAHIAAQDWQLAHAPAVGAAITPRAGETPPLITPATAPANPYADLDPDAPLIRTLWRLVPGQRGDYLRGIIWKLIDGACAAWPGLVVYLILLELFRSPVDTGRIRAYVLVLVALFAGQILCNFLAQRAMLRVVAGMHHDLRLFLADYLCRLPLGFFTRRDTGAIDSLFTTNIAFLDVRFPTDMLISGVVAPTLMFVTMLFIDWRLALAAGVGIPVGLLVLRLAMGTFGRIWATLRAARVEANSRMVEYIQGIAVIRAFGLTGERFVRFRAAMEAYRRASARTITGTTGATIGFTSAMELGYAALLALGVALLLDGALAPERLLLFLFLALAFYQPLLLLGELTAFQRIIANAVRNLNEFLRTPTLPEPEVVQQSVGSAVAFDRVSFRYDDRPVLRDVSFALPERGLIALVGPSGSGKTTIANLLARFWEVDEGSVRIGGVDVRELRSEDLQARLTMVFQDVYLFRDTVRANIALGKPGATDAEIEAAARAARCHDFIAALPAGYATLVGEGGATLSGGEKQRISIARALLKDAPIVVLDEATSSIDPENEWQIQAAFDALAGEKTLLVIAHRLATLQRADQIIVLQDGAVAQRGTHTELSGKDGLYRRFWDERQRAKGWKLAAGAAQPTFGDD